MDFDSVKLYAKLLGTWTDISADWLGIVSTSVSAGIRGAKPVDVLASPGTFRFTLENNTYKYFPSGPSPLAGWGKGTPIKLVFTLSGVDRVRFTGFVDVLDYVTGKLPNHYKCNVTAVTWLGYAADNPIETPGIITNVYGGNAVAAVLDKMAVQPTAYENYGGDYVFPAVFDSTGRETTALAEFGKIVMSESLGRIYERLDGTLVFENSSKRDATDPQALIVDAANLGDVILSIAGDHILSIAGDSILQNPTKAADFVTAIDDITPVHGRGIINRVKFTAYPKRIDIEPQVVYSLDKPLLIPAAGTVSFYAPYTDQQTGRAINAIPESMLTPEVPGATDPYLVAALSFNDAIASSTAADTTGRHTWTFQAPPQIVEDVLVDAFSIQRISGNVIGPYALFQGFGNSNITTPTSADFEFGSGAFTIGWYESRINIVDDQATMARDATSAYPPFLLGKLDAASREMKIYMSSNGASWDIANGRTMGRVNASKWTHYEVSRDEDGWFYAFSDGKLTDKWYSSLALPANGNAFSIGRTQNTEYAYFGFDELYIKKGQCLHKTDFTPPVLEVSTTLPGDYLMNTAEYGSGTDISSDLVITATYDSVGAQYTLTNNNASAGYVWYLTARGLGIYPYSPIDDVVQDSTSISANGYLALDIRQQYQQDLTAGRVTATDIVANYKDQATRIPAITIMANYNIDNMYMFLTLDIGDLVRVTHAPSGVSLQYYYIQSIDYSVQAGKIVRVTYGLQPDFEH